MLPYGARPIAEARLRGQRPADLLIVSLVGPLDEVNPVIVADPAKQYDWRFMIDLKACIFARPGVRFSPVVLEIARHLPLWLGLWDVDAEEGADCCTYIKPESIDKRTFGAGDYAVMYWPWSQWENRQFKNETHPLERVGL